MARLASLFLLAVLMLAGCSSGNHLVGQWTDDSGKFLVTIRPDGGFAYDFDETGSHVNITGTWTYEGSTIRYEPKTLSVTGGQHPEEKRQAALKKAMKPTVETLEWQDNDNFLAHLQDGNLTMYHRKK